MKLVNNLISAVISASPSPCAAPNRHNCPTVSCTHIGTPNASASFSPSPMSFTIVDSFAP